ncbi:ATP-binding cassette domain-containing protein, partial [Kitasatospora sp. SC0581]|uniref:ATP-binding cassette domain-containing protein n=1 Tax=Kitasatospora sp. SC0581 TaxID=3394360 RepID=UPI003A888166
PPVAEPAEPVALPERPLPVAVRGLPLRHPGQTVAALAGEDLDLAAGRRIAGVGPSGSGKTTLAQALLRCLEPSAGTVRFADGRPEAVDSRARAGESVRRVIG